MSNVGFHRGVQRAEANTMQPSKHPSLSSHLGVPVRAAILCGVALAFFTLAGAPAFAQDLGDLKAQLEALHKRNEQL